MSNEKILTKEGFANLKSELDNLKKNKRKEIATRIQVAKDFGDLSENAEYHEAKNEQGFIEGRILELENIIKTATVVEKNASADVGVGDTVTLQFGETEVVYHIVGATEADPAKNKVSVESPIGSALIEKRINDEVVVTTPVGDKKYIIKKIT